MVTISPDHIRDLGAANYTRALGRGYAVLAIVEGELEVASELTAQARGWPVVYDQPRLIDWLNGEDLTDESAQILADDLTDMLARDELPDTDRCR